MKALMFLVVALVVCGCDSREKMRGDFPDGVVVEMTDQNGNRYVVAHHFDDTYTIKQIKK